MKCIVCDSENVSQTNAQLEGKLPYGEPYTYEAVECSCADCNESWYNIEPGAIDPAAKARLKATAQSIPKMLDDLADRGITPQYIERALELPSGTLQECREDASNLKVSPSSVALLRIIRTYTWILETAEQGFRKD